MATVTFSGGWVGGWVGQRPKRKFAFLKSTSNFGPPFDKFHFFPEERRCDVDGWVGEAEEPRLPFRIPPLPR